ncbi:hypothetical protein Y032_0004g1713 [Ancylostoma ceylanicum]|uniref:Uncharacterized protein n=1 Tax=Ancylostoma ceylanicum TaxID=53326 RepID=A0A016VSX4_9BILA|nr:hypothetical protein Y032_0004g1713 [Ancylostoma ceylanicum]
MTRPQQNLRRKSTPKNCLDTSKYGACGTVVRGSHRKHTDDGSIAYVASQAIRLSAVGELIPEESRRMKH